MDFIADENIDRPIFEKLRDRSFNVLYVEEDMKGVSDEKVIDKAIDEGLILITFDSDFSDIKRAHPGVIRITRPERYQVIIEMIDELSDTFSEKDFRNTIVEASPRDFN